MFRSHAIVLFLSVPTIGLLAAGCSEDPKATPQVIFDGRIERGSGNDCSDDSPVFTVGDFGNQAATPPVASKAAKDGDASGQGSVSVSCTVSQAGNNEFNVAASVALSGANGGLFRIDGKFTASGDQSHIHALFSTRLTTNEYEESDCTVRYLPEGAAGIAAGRVWGEVTCPHAVFKNNNAQNKQCQGVASFRFENCAQ